jgi:HlyD family secretion protein
VKTAEENLRNVRAGGKAQDIANAQATVLSAQAQLASAQQKLAEMKAGPKPEDVAQAQAALVQAQQQLALKAVPYTAQDIAQQQAAVAQAEQQLALKTSPYTIRDLQTAEASVAQAQASLSMAQYNLDNAVLVAPFDGMISSVGYSVGTWSSSAGTVGAAGILLVDLENVRLDVNIDEVDVAKVAIGQPCVTTFDAISGVQFLGKVLAIAPEAKVQSGVVTYLASVSLDPRQGPVRAGMSGNVGITVAERNNVLVVPNRAVRTQGRNRVVDVVLDGDKTETRTVRVGMANDQLTEVQAGLTEGETVVIPTTTTTAPRVGGPQGGPMMVP